MVKDWCKARARDGRKGQPTVREASLDERVPVLCHDTGYEPLSKTTRCLREGGLDPEPACRLIPDFCKAASFDGIGSPKVTAAAFEQKGQVSCGERDFVPFEEEVACGP